MDKTTKNGSI